MATGIQSDAYRHPLEHVRWGRVTIPGAAATVAASAGYLGARAVKGPCAVTLVAASAGTDKLTINFPAAQADAAAQAGLKVTLEQAGGDTLAVEASDATGVITIKLAKTTAGKNTATLIQAAIRAVTPAQGTLGTVKGVSVAAIVCTAAGNWNSAAIAPAANMSGVDFEGGGGEVVPAEDLLAQPGFPRNVTVKTIAGTAGDVAPVRAVVYGTDMDDKPLIEQLPAWTENTAGEKSGVCAFKTIEKVFLPSHDGTDLTLELGYGEVLGLPLRLAKKPMLWATKKGVIETTAPTITNDAAVLAKNTVDLHSALNGDEVCIYIATPEA